MNKTINITSLIGVVLASAGIIAVTLLIVYDIMARYLFNRPFPLIIDLSEIIIAAAIFLGLAYTFYRRAHIRMELVTSHLQQRVQTWLRLVTYVIGLGFVGILTSQSWTLAIHSYQENARSVGDLPLYIPQITVALGLSLFLLVVLLTTSQHIWHILHREENSNFTEAFGKGSREET